MSAWPIAGLAEYQVSLLFLSPALNPDGNVTKCREEELAGCPQNHNLQGMAVFGSFKGSLEESKDMAILHPDT